jgi:hypothetical protein
MFDLHGIEKGGSSDKISIFTCQGMNEEDFEGWVSTTGGQINISRPQLSSKTEMQSINFFRKNSERTEFFFWLDELDDAGFDFVKKCIQVIERRGLDEQGLYRIVGMQSKVNSLVAGHFGKIPNILFQPQTKINFLSFLDVQKTLAQRLATPVEEDMELKTLCSALKLYLRTLKEPLFTFKLHNRFIEAASTEISKDFNFF